MNILIYIYKDVEVLDFAGPYEVFSTAARVINDFKLFNVSLIAESENLVTARNQFTVKPKYSFENHPEPDVILVPGGVHMDEMKKETVKNWLNKNSKKCKIVSSVCTGSFILAAANVYTNQQVTTHWDDIEELQRSFPELTVIENVRWVEDGKYVSSAGISAGIDMALHLVSKIHSEELAVNTARLMDFEWTKNK